MRTAGQQLNTYSLLTFWKRSTLVPEYSLACIPCPFDRVILTVKWSSLLAMDGCLDAWIPFQYADNSWLTRCRPCTIPASFDNIVHDERATAGSLRARLIIQHSLGCMNHCSPPYPTYIVVGSLTACLFLLQVSFLVALVGCNLTAHFSSLSFFFPFHIGI